MKKTLLIMLLACGLLLICAGTALADDFSVSADPGEGRHAVVIDEGENSFSVYTDASSVKLSFTLKEGYDLRIGSYADAAPADKGVVTDTLTGTASYSVGPAGSEERTVYTYTLKPVSVAIDAGLYKTADGSAKYDATDKGKVLVPDDVTPYAKISVTGADGVCTVTGAGEINENGYAALSNFDDMDLSAAVEVKVGGVSFARRSFELLRPTLSTINFNSKASNTSDRTLTIQDGIYAYDTAEQVSSDWSTIYFQVNPLCTEASVKVEQAKADIEPSGGWYSQRMNKDCYDLTVTVTVAVEDKKVEQEYTVYLMDDKYAGPQVKTFAAREKADGQGAEYLTVVDNVGRIVYVLLPEGVSTFWASAEAEGTVSSIQLAGSEIEAGKWYEHSDALDGKKLTLSDAVGISYSYNIRVLGGADKSDQDASLRSLRVRSGSKQSTADNVALSFAADTLDYSFPVDAGDVYLYIAAAANDSDATVFINDQLTTAFTVTDLDTDAVSVFRVLVVAGDHVTTKTYTLAVNGATGLLQTLSASNIKGLSPAYKSDISTYTGYTEAGTASTYIVALAKNYSSDYVQISKANYNNYGQVASYTALTKVTQGGANVTASLNTGSNIFRVDVLPGETATTVKGTYYMCLYVPTADPKCTVSSQKLYVNGKEQTLSAYNIAGNNYLKLRDIAALLDGTVKEMNVGWEEEKWTATMAMPGTFTPRGDELSTLTSPVRYDISTQYFTYNTLPVYPLAYNVTGSGDAAGSNYVMLRDVASLLNFSVTYNATSQAIYIDTASKYTPGL